MRFNSRAENYTLGSFELATPVPAPFLKAIAVPISGLVVVLDAPGGPYPYTIEQLRSHVAIEVGEITDSKIAIVVDSTSQQNDQEIWHWVQELPGVIDIHIAFVGFDGDQTDSDDQHPSSTTNS